MITTFYKRIVAKFKNLFKRKDRSLLDIANREKKVDKQLKPVLTKGHNEVGAQEGV